MSGLIPHPQKFRARALFLSALLALGSTAQAANILIVKDASSTASDAANLQAVCFPGSLITSPTDTVDVEAALPADLSGYDQIWDLRYATPLTAADQTAYTGYLNLGKNLFVMGENSTNFAARDNSIFSLVSALGGGTLVLTADDGFSSLNPQDVMPPYNTTPNAMTTASLDWSAVVTTPGTGQWILYDSINNQGGSAVAWPTRSLTNATAGSLSVVFDVNFMQAPPTSGSANNPQFLQNLCATVATGGHPTGAIALTLLSAPTRAVSQLETVQATVTDANGDPLADTDVTFTVTDGPNKGQTGTVKTDAKGVATFSYIGSGGVGTDSIQASVTISGVGTLDSNTLAVVWQASTLAAAVPTLGEAALAALGLLLAGAGMGALRRRRVVA